MRNTVRQDVLVAAVVEEGATALLDDDDFGYPLEANGLGRYILCVASFDDKGGSKQSVSCRGSFRFFANVGSRSLRAEDFSARKAAALRNAMDPGVSDPQKLTQKFYVA